MKDACQAGLLGGGGVGFLFASGLARPWTDRAAALRGCPGSPSGAWVLLASRWPRSGDAAPQAVPATRRPASRPAASKTRVVAASAPPIGPPRHHQCAPHLLSTTNVPNGKSWSCTAWQDLCVGVHGGLGLPQAGWRGGGHARGHLRVRALLGGAWRAAHPRTADGTHCRSARSLSVFSWKPVKIRYPTFPAAQPFVYYALRNTQYATMLTANHVIRRAFCASQNTQEAENTQEENTQRKPYCP